jgi:hypothetical protein
MDVVHRFDELPPSLGLYVLRTLTMTNDIFFYGA